MHLTAIFKLRTNNHDACRLRIAIARYRHAKAEALARAKRDFRMFLRCLVPDKDGRLKIDTRQLHAEVLRVTERPQGLHSSVHMSLIVDVEGTLASWLALRAEWIRGGKKNPVPAFPTVPPGSDRMAAWQYQRALEQSDRLMTLREEDHWRAAVTRAGRHRLIPFEFGAATSGAKGAAHMGLLRREDGRLFALLTLFPKGDRRGEAIERARNRRDRGEIMSLRSELPYRPGARTKSSILVPIEMARGFDRVFMARGIPKSAEIVHKEGTFYLHVAFEYPHREPLEPLPNICAVVRGVTTLLAALILAPDGQVVTREVIDGKDLRRLITAIRHERKIRQKKGQSTKGDRRQARVVEHHLYSLVHQVIRLARENAARVVLLVDRRGRLRNPYLGYRHMSRIEAMLMRLAPEARLPPPLIRPLYGSARTCPHCGLCPEARPTARPSRPEENCSRCGAQRLPESDLAHLLALDSLRLTLGKEKRPSLAEYLRERWAASHASGPEVRTADSS